MNVNVTRQMYKNWVSGLQPNPNLVTPINRVKTALAVYPFKKDIFIYREDVDACFPDVTNFVPCSDEYILAMMGNRQHDVITTTGTSSGIPAEDIIRWSVRGWSPIENQLFQDNITAWVATRRLYSQSVTRDSIRFAATLIYLRETDQLSDDIPIGRISEAFFENIIETNILNTVAERARLPVAVGPIPASVISDPTPLHYRSINSLFIGNLGNLGLEVVKEDGESVSIAYLEDYFGWRRLPPTGRDIACIGKPSNVTHRMSFPAQANMHKSTADDIKCSLEEWTRDRLGQGLAATLPLRRAMCSILIFLSMTQCTRTRTEINNLRHLFVCYVHEEYSP